MIDTWMILLEYQPGVGHGFGDREHPAVGDCPLLRRDARPRAAHNRAPFGIEAAGRVQVGSRADPENASASDPHDNGDRRRPLREGEVGLAQHGRARPLGIGLGRAQTSSGRYSHISVLR